MRWLAGAVFLAGLAALVWQKTRPAAPPPPAPVPPAILSEPAPVLAPEEQKKILKSAEDPDPRVRWESAVLLDKLGSPEAKALLFRLLAQDPDPQVRVQTAERLAGRKSPEVTAALSAAMKDAEASVRLAALRGLERLGDYSAAAAIASGPVKDQDEAVRLQALKTINTLQDLRQAEIEEARRRYEREKQAAAEAGRGR